MKGSTTLQKLNCHFAQQLGCRPEDLDRRGLDLVPAEEVEGLPASLRPPFWAVVRAEGAVVSASPSTLEPTSDLLARTAPGDLLSVPTRERLLRRLRASGRSWLYSVGQQLYCDPLTFTPQQSHPVRRLSPEDLEELAVPSALASAHEALSEGRVFAIARDRTVVSYATIRSLSRWAGDVTVTTDAPHRRCGYGRSVVSAATNAILEQGKIAVYACDGTNEASLRLALSLGYRKYADDLFFVGDLRTPRTASQAGCQEAPSIAQRR